METGLVSRDGWVEERHVMARVAPVIDACTHEPRLRGGDKLPTCVWTLDDYYIVDSVHFKARLANLSRRFEIVRFEYYMRDIIP